MDERVIDLTSGLMLRCSLAVRVFSSQSSLKSTSRLNGGIIKATFHLIIIYVPPQFWPEVSRFSQIENNTRKQTGILFGYYRSAYANAFKPIK